MEARLTYSSRGSILVSKGGKREGRRTFVGESEQPLAKPLMLGGLFPLSLIPGITVRRSFEVRATPVNELLGVPRRK